VRLKYCKIAKYLISESIRWICSSLGKVLLSMILAAKNMPATAHEGMRNELICAALCKVERSVHP
jgi:hypothetical protein